MPTLEEFANGSFDQGEGLTDADAKNTDLMNQLAQKASDRLNSPKLEAAPVPPAPDTYHDPRYFAPDPDAPANAQALDVPNTLAAKGFSIKQINYDDGSVAAVNKATGEDVSINRNQLIALSRQANGLKGDQTHNDLLSYNTPDTALEGHSKFDATDLAKLSFGTDNQNKLDAAMPWAQAKYGIQKLQFTNDGTLVAKKDGVWAKVRDDQADSGVLSSIGRMAMRSPGAAVQVLTTGAVDGIVGPALVAAGTAVAGPAGAIGGAALTGSISAAASTMIDDGLGSFMHTYTLNKDVGQDLGVAAVFGGLTGGVLKGAGVAKGALGSMDNPVVNAIKKVGDLSQGVKNVMAHIIDDGSQGGAISIRSALNDTAKTNSVVESYTQAAREELTPANIQDRISSGRPISPAAVMQEKMVTDINQNGQNIAKQLITRPQEIWAASKDELAANITPGEKEAIQRNASTMVGNIKDRLNDMGIGVDPSEKAAAQQELTKNAKEMATLKDKLALSKQTISAKGQWDMEAGHPSSNPDLNGAEPTVATDMASRPNGEQISGQDFEGDIKDHWQMKNRMQDLAARQEQLTNVASAKSLTGKNIAEAAGAEGIAMSDSDGNALAKNLRNTYRGLQASLQSGDVKETLSNIQTIKQLEKNMPKSVTAQAQRAGLSISDDVSKALKGSLSQANQDSLSNMETTYSKQMKVTDALMSKSWGDRGELVNNMMTKGIQENADGGSKAISQEMLKMATPEMKAAMDANIHLMGTKTIIAQKPVMNAVDNFAKKSFWSALWSTPATLVRGGAAKAALAKNQVVDAISSIGRTEADIAGRKASAAALSGKEDAVRSSFNYYNTVIGAAKEGAIPYGIREQLKQSFKQAGQYAPAPAPTPTPKAAEPQDQ